MIRFQLLVGLAVIVGGLPAVSAEVQGQPEQPRTPSSRLEAALAPDQRHHLEAGWQAYQRGNFAEALKIYQDISALVPNDASLWYDIGCLYALTRQFREARASLQKALALNPGVAPAHDALGQVEEQEHHMAEARDSYARAAGLGPRNPKFLRHLVHARFRLGESEGLRFDLAHLVLLDSSDTDARYALGVLELRDNAPELALHEFQQVTRTRPNDVMAWNGLGLAYARTGAFHEARKALEHAKALEPTNVHTLTNLGIVAAYQEDWDDARAAWQSTLELDPRFAPARQNLEALPPIEPSSP